MPSALRPDGRADCTCSTSVPPATRKLTVAAPHYAYCALDPLLILRLVRDLTNLSRGTDDLTSDLAGLWARGDLARLSYRLAAFLAAGKADGRADGASA